MRALVVGSSGGIGSALVAALTARGYAVTGVSRRGDGLDVTDEASVARVLGALEPGFDLVIEPPVPHSDPLTMTQALNASLEAQVRAHPEQWLWIHNRWKT